MNQLAVEVGGDVDQMERWDPYETGHGRLLNQLGGRVTDAAPLHLLRQMRLEASDVDSQLFVVHGIVPGVGIILCLTIQQRDDLCNNGRENQIAAFDEQGGERMLKLKKRMQSGPDTRTYVLKRDWTEMVKANGWKGGDDKIKIWGLPHAGLRDQSRFGPHHDFNDITFVFTNAV